jgi:uncharacterized protein (DUF302 family)
MERLHETIHDELPRVREHLEAALAAEGFGVLTHIDVRATLKEKLGVDREEHHILGVCNPQLAAQALDADPDVALLLPCTVTLRDASGATEVRVLDPARAFELADSSIRDELEPLAADARRRLARALQATVGASTENGAAS